jgi:hypothetical protein
MRFEALHDAALQARERNDRAAKEPLAAVEAEVARAIAVRVVGCLGTVSAGCRLSIFA